MNIEEKIKNNFELKDLTTWKIGGCAKKYIEIKDKEELSPIIEWAKLNDCNYFILGGGSNVLINDLGIDGLVIKLTCNDVVVQGERLNAGAGAPLSKIVQSAMSSSLSGLEWAIGIPGTIGGAIRGNAGAYGQSIENCVETIEIFSVKTEKFYKLSRRDCEFEYRGSLFKHNPDLIIWSASFKLVTGQIETIRSTSIDYIEKRTRSQPKLPSAGSVFKNIIFEKLQEDNPLLAKKAEDEGRVKGGKVAAGWIIDQLDLKGKTIGDAKISLEHANFIVNTGKATSLQVITLISYVKQQVRDKLKILLEEEIQYFGF